MHRRTSINNIAAMLGGIGTEKKPIENIVHIEASGNSNAGGKSLKEQLLQALQQKNPNLEKMTKVTAPVASISVDECIEIWTRNPNICSPDFDAIELCTLHDCLNTMVVEDHMVGEKYHILRFYCSNNMYVLIVHSMIMFVDPCGKLLSIMSNSSGF